MSNQCPNCGQEAMSASHKLLQRPHVCRNCGTEVRMNLVYTLLVSLLYFGFAVQALIGGGFSSGALFRVLIMTLLYIAVCLFIPFEVKPSGENK